MVLETRLPAAPLAVPDWCVRRTQAPLGRKRGDEGGALGRVRCRGTLTKLALDDSVDHTLKKLPSLFAAVVVDDTQFQAVGKSQQVSQQLQRVRLFTQHAEEVAGLVVSSKKLEIIANDERIRTDVRNNKVHADAVCTCTRNPGVDHACGGKRTGAKVMAMRAKRFRVKMTFLECLRPAGEACQDRCRPLFDPRF